MARRVAGAADLDEFGHVNNVRYIAWALDAAWAHSKALGVSFEDYQRVGVGCVVWRQEFEYLAPVVAGEAVDIATWIAENDGRLRLVRAYDMRRADGARVFRGRTTFVTIDIKTGKPARMPSEFVRAYKPAE
ncbi:MAG: thioesterase family protein [Parvularculaceae bacterium]